MQKNKRSEDKEPTRSCNILVYGIEKMGFDLPSKEIKCRNYCLVFEKFNTKKRFNDFDGVILFQGIFESFQYQKVYYGDSHYKHSCDENELDKRKKELEILFKKKGFVCFLLNRKFIDLDGPNNYLSTDLAKFYLNYKNLSRDNYGSRITIMGCLQLI